jgi:thioredoxin reductase
LEAHRRDLSYIVLEQGNLADTIRKYPRKKLLLAEPITVPLYGDLWISDGSKEELLRIWEAIVENVGLRVETNCRVTAIERVGSSPFEITAGDRTLLARRVVLAMGRRGTPRHLGVPGEDLGKVFYDIVEMEEFAGTKALVVGGGDSALESALGLANQLGTQVTLSYRGVGFDKAKERNRNKLDVEVAAGRVKLLLESNVLRIEPDEVTLSTPGGELRLANDVVIIRAGGIPPTGFLRDLGIGMVKKDIPIAQAEETRVG